MINPERYIAKIVNDNFIKQVQDLPEAALMTLYWPESEEGRGDAIHIATPPVLAEATSWEGIEEKVSEKFTTGEIKPGEKIMVIKQITTLRLACRECETCKTDCKNWNEQGTINSFKFIQMPQSN